MRTTLKALLVLGSEDTNLMRPPVQVPLSKDLEPVKSTLLTQSLYVSTIRKRHEGWSRLLGTSCVSLNGLAPPLTSAVVIAVASFVCIKSSVAC